MSSVAMLDEGILAVYLEANVRGFKGPLTKNLLGFPEEKQVLKLIASGERCTWPKLEMIRL